MACAWHFNGYRCRAQYRENSIQCARSPFGYLTFDEKLCDVIQSAYPLYMLVYIPDMVFLMALVVMILQEQGSTKKILAVCGIATAVSIIGILYLRIYRGASGNVYYRRRWQMSSD